MLFRHTILVFTLLFCVFRVEAQRTFTLQDYNEQTIYLEAPNRYIKNNQVYTGQRALAAEFRMSPGGMNLYVRSKRNRNIAAVVSLLGTAGSIYALVNRNQVNWKPFFWVSLGTGIISVPLNAAANRQLNQAVWLRNRDVLLQASPEQ